ncbi:UDP-glucose 4-epimerase GalE [Sphingomonas astaxanthinifaciens]|uniref:UDP-glucose 4-epimerase n=1 Tax=Sphingomonas astaxanthinifaciens DSM 22298 TaxID=1123267 RepID=A0ABQ5Z9R2_9SPHN|nr:UDP-glucose 4-epimerase GalE [Sphingomonas astaxanthinifaciens]GLR48741.1 UDP-glucose 4-epimerase GalE [Sphingomonas astaxanthinifaciens DSM 22298]
MSKPPVLVTGGAGYIGSHAVLALHDAGWPVVVVDNLSNGTREAVPDAVPLIEADIGDAAAMETILQEQGVAAIMHFAGSIVVPESVTDPHFYYRNNTVATHALVGAALKQGVRHLLFSSTAATYGAPETVPIDEDTPTRPINPYGWSKLMSEQMLRDCAAAYDVNFGALRYFNVAGADPKGRSGQVGKGATHLLKVACEAAVGKRTHVDVFGTDYPTPDGTCIRDYIHVADLANAHVLALEALIAEPKDSFTLNCGYGRGTSVLEMLDALDRVNGTPVKRVMGPRRAGDPPQLVAANRRLVERLGWQPRFADTDVIIESALSWERRLYQKEAATCA